MFDNRLLQQGETALVVAHRGDAAAAPENTLTALTAAARAGADAIEIDLQLSSDGVPVVIHDHYLDRTTDGAGPVRERTWTELRSLRVGEAGRIPSLVEALAWSTGAGLPLLAEVKTQPHLDPGMVDALARVLGDGRAHASSLVLYSADHHLLAALARRVPHVARGVVVNQRAGFLAASIAAAGARLVSQSVEVLTPDAVAEAHELGCVVASGVRHPAEAALLRSWGVDALVGDRLGVAELRALVDGVRL